MVIERDQKTESSDKDSTREQNHEIAKDDKNDKNDDTKEEHVSDLDLSTSETSKKSMFELEINLIEAFRERCNSLDSVLKEERKLTLQARRTVRRHSVHRVQWIDESSNQKIPLQAEIPIPVPEEENSESDELVPLEPIKIPTEKPRPILKKRKNRVDPNQPNCVVVIHKESEDS